MKVTVLHNLQLTPEGWLAILARYGSENAYQPGDTLAKVYELVVSGRPDMAALESVYELLNINHPRDYLSRSLSKGDVLILDRVDHVVAYWCDSVGWERITEPFAFLNPKPGLHMENCHPLPADSWLLDADRAATQGRFADRRDDS